ncbi:MAG: selenium cofactor biosynthesis protein YqeC [bacterium]|nr:selenium cofactor biosynthesis protein YqeC [bacterium]
MNRRIYVVGAGGKTTLIDCLARYFKEKGRRVLILTTTHRMLPENDAVLFETSNSGDAVTILRKKMEQAEECSEGVILEFGQIVKDKAGELRMGCPEKTVFHAACEMAEIVLVEADGSRRLPIKVPAEHEPVIFDDADLIFVVQGLAAVGKKRENVCHRLKLAENLLLKEEFAEAEGKAEQKLSEAVSLEEIGILMKRGYLEPLRARFPKAKVIPVLNQADSEEIAQRGRHMLENLGETRSIVGSLRDGGAELLLAEWMKAILEGEGDSILPESAVRGDTALRTG